MKYRFDVLSVLGSYPSGITFSGLRGALELFEKRNRLTHRVFGCGSSAMIGKIVRSLVAEGLVEVVPGEVASPNTDRLKITREGAVYLAASSWKSSSEVY